MKASRTEGCADDPRVEAMASVLDGAPNRTAGTHRRQANSPERTRLSPPSPR
jgi:hypothetical protein